jgi:hypothetical protein
LAKVWHLLSAVVLGKEPAAQELFETPSINTGSSEVF